MTENGVAARRDAKAGEQLARHLTSGAVTHHRQDIGDGVGLMRAGRGKSGQPLSEDQAVAGRRLASPFPDPELYNDRDPLACRTRVDDRVGHALDVRVVGNGVRG